MVTKEMTGAGSEDPEPVGAEDKTGLKYIIAYRNLAANRTTGIFQLVGIVQSL